VADDGTSRPSCRSNLGDHLDRYAATPFAVGLPSLFSCAASQPTRDGVVQRPRRPQLPDWLKVRHISISIKNCDTGFGTNMRQAEFRGGALNASYGVAHSSS
jgi:hypothetical protein